MKIFPIELSADKDIIFPIKLSADKGHNSSKEKVTNIIDKIMAYNKVCLCLYASDIM